MKKSILQGLRTGEKVSIVLRATYGTHTGQIRDDR